MSRKGMIKFTIVSIWLAVMGWLIRFEAFPHLFDPTLQGYRDLSRNLPALRDSWMKVMSGDQHVGYINSSIEMKEEEGEERLQMSTQALVRVFFQGKLDLMRLTNQVTLDARQELIGSLSSFSLGTYSGSLQLEPAGAADKFIMSIRFNDIKMKREIQIPRGAIISSLFMDTGLRSVKAGKTVTLRTVDPFSFSGELNTVEVTGLSSEWRRLPGESRDVLVTRVRMKTGELEVEAEVDEYGRIIRQETPFGLTFEQSEAGVAMKIPKGQGFDPMQILSDRDFSGLVKLPGGL